MSFSDNEKQNERNARARQSRERLESTVKDMLRTPQGAHFLRWLMDETGVFRSTLTDERKQLWLEGRRSVGVQVLEICTATGFADVLLQKEMTDE